MPKHPAKQVLHLAAAGGVGTGKSTTLRAMSGGSSDFVPGDSAKGTTKTFVPASFDFGQIAIAIHDVPGVGDWDVKPALLLDMYEAHLKGIDVGGLLLFFNVMNPKLDLTPQLMLSLMDLAFPDHGAEKWDSVIIVGTHKDVAGPERCAKFKSSGEGSIREMIGEIVEGAKVKHMCCISPNDMSELEALIERVSESKGIGRYRTPDADKFAAIAAKCLGVEEEAVLSDGSGNPQLKVFIDEIRGRAAMAEDRAAMTQEQMMQMLAEMAKRPQVPEPQFQPGAGPSTGAAVAQGVTTVLTTAIGAAAKGGACTIS